MVSLREAVGEGYRNLRHGGPGVLLELASRSYFRHVATATGTPAYDRDWDLLVVLDACRSDLFEEVAPAFDLGFDDAAASVTSVGATSTEWLERTFVDAPDDVVAETAYVTANPYSTDVLDSDRFRLVDEVWRYAWDDDVGTVPARPVTDRTIAAARETDADRIVAHYMQPHFPCVPEPGAVDGIALDEFGDEPVSVWEELRFGVREEAAVWDLYRENLRYVIEEVALLLSNVDADPAVVTADHGNAVGEWGLYGHAEGIALPCLRSVPWCATTATDRGTHDPETVARRDADADVGDRLAALGYRDGDPGA